MRPPPFDYLEPTTVAEACAELERHRDRCAVLAGGQSLVAQLNARLRRPAFVLSLARLPELAAVDLSSANVRIGAAVTQREVQRGGAGEALPVLREALECVGHVPTRNRGTVGGSIAFADPTAELPAVLLALGATVALRSVAGERTVPASEFFVGPFRTVMRPDELLVSVSLPVPAGGAWAFEQRHFRRHAKVSVVAGSTGDAGIIVAAAGVTDTPVLLPQCHADTGPDSMAAAVTDLVTPNGDHYGSPGYRRRLAAAATGAAVRRVLEVVPGSAAA